MNEFDPKNDVIDRYLKGELDDQARKVFEEELDENADLKKTLEERRLVYEVIVHYGNVELKNFIRKHATHQRVFTISKRNIFYAAAAIALILLATTVVLLNLRKQTEQKTQEIAGKKKDVNKSKNKENVEIDNIGSTQENKTSWKVDSLTGQPDSMALLVAANVKVVSIDLAETDYNEETPETATMAKASAVKARSRAESVRATETTTDDFATLKDTLILNQPLANKRLQSSIRLNMNFYNTASGEKMVVYEIGSSGEPQLDIYNLPYDNPLLFADGNNTYLKAGNEYYQIELNAGKVQKVKPVNDSKVIQRINR